MKLYLIYASIDAYIYDSEIKFLLPNQSVFQREEMKMKGLYAWTTKKKLLNEFREARDESNIYMYLKKEIDTEEFKIFKSDYNMLELKSYGYFKGYDEKHESEYINIVSTKNEFIVITEEGVTYIQEDLDEMLLNLDIYRCFNDKMMKAITLLGLKYQCDNMYGDEELVDYINYQMSFDVSDSIIKPKDWKNEFSMLIYLFQYMFIGTGRKEGVS